MKLYIFAVCVSMWSNYCSIALLNHDVDIGLGTNLHAHLRNFERDGMCDNSIIWTSYMNKLMSLKSAWGNEVKNCQF